MSGALRQFSARQQADDFDRLAVTNLVEWWEASDLALSDGSAVASWAGAKGARTLSQGTSARRPVFQTNQINGLPAVFFDYDQLNTTGSLSQPNTYFAVVRNQTLFIVFDGSSPDRNLLYVPSSGDWEMFAGASVSTVVADTSWHVHTAVFDGANSVHRIDGVQVGAGDTGAASLGTLTVGNTATLTSVPEGWVACLAVVDGLLSASERADVEGHLLSRYAI